MKTVAVLGASYGGNRAAQLLTQELPEGWRVVLVDRNTHFNHLYALPRFAVLPEHAHKAFIPYTRVLGAPQTTRRHLRLHAQVTALSTHSATLSRAFPEHGLGETLRFDYLVYALGSHLPAPIDLWGPVDAAEEEYKERTPAHNGSKASGIAWLERFRAVVERTPSVLVVGGGALGIQYATDIADVFPQKRVTLLHSRKQLLPKYEERMHDEIMSSLSEMNVKAVLGERLDLSVPPKIVHIADGTKERVVKTQSGRELHAGLVLLCTGQRPNTALLQAAIPDAIIAEGASKGLARVHRSMQVAVPRTGDSNPVTQMEDALARTSVTDGTVPTDTGCPDEMYVPHPHIFACGDAADAFGAIKAGHTAHYQAEVAARNILKLVAHEQQPEGPAPDLEEYIPGEPAIKVSLGLVQGVVDRKAAVGHDLETPLMWRFYGFDPTEETMRM
ncbi:hypothetical protein PHLGIDRAFT_25487 [Phlebiopsis gigantea 11061_1 CR5-6]|uniref:FAD/NAD(P)-binding domain-containing protein n=1 Tax=Phlebiopsis gigantea (strain 11061_1 CR5-6) TaxID=745531 RepID=A0A0C3S7C9_PHLG1|nr:hypothetical protein PHLGIDRAFT_25487 [Phlebiopsis gigantea 11061_1 CR5-6]